ncbi:MAG TPA: chloride channel protein [Acidobacteriota bacterium]|nr:chloride channel protein [Acidobacteriota bacterium]
MRISASRLSFFHKNGSPGDKSEEAEDRLADFTRDMRVVYLSLMSVVIGVVSALVAWALVWLIAVITNLSYFHHYSSNFISPDARHLGVFSVCVPALGGLIIGFMARYGSEKIRGHGIPEAIEAILVDQSRMDLRVAVLKPVSSAISIGTGGPFGAEGPIIMTGGAFGSLFAQLFHLSAAERKTLLVAGAAGGMSAIFATPVAAVLIAVELLLFEWKPRSLVPVGVASIVASALRVPLLGQGPIFPVQSHPVLGGAGLAIAFVVGLIAGLGSSLLTLLVYWFEDLFGKMPIHWMWWPAIGGLIVGLGGLVNPRVLGVGYDTIHALLRGEVFGPALIGLLIGKAVVWSVALGSGTSGGVLAPLLIMGGALGAFEANFIPTGDVGLWAMISMAAMMGGTMRSPLTSIVFTLELTHDLNILPGLLIGALAAHVVTVLLMRRSILTEKVARHGHHLMREYSVDPLEMLRVKDVMDTSVPTIPARMRVSELSDLIAHGDPQLTPRQATPILDENGRLAGIITRGDVVRALAKDPQMTVLEAGNRSLIVCYPEEVLRDAVDRMLKHNIGRVLVVSREDPGKLLGYLGRSRVMAARLMRLKEEVERESGFQRLGPALTKKVNDRRHTADPSSPGEA